LLTFTTATGATATDDGGAIIAGHNRRQTELPDPDLGTPAVFDWDPYLIKVKADGSLDSTFGEAGVINLEAIFPDPEPEANLDLMIDHIIIQPDDQLLMRTDHNEIIRINQQGEIDEGLGENGVLVPSAEINGEEHSLGAIAITQLSNGDIVATGSMPIDGKS